MEDPSFFVSCRIKIDRYVSLIISLALCLMKMIPYDNINNSNNKNNNNTCMRIQGVLF